MAEEANKVKVAAGSKERTGSPAAKEVKPVVKAAVTSTVAGAARKDSSKSTAVGEWEMRDGKYYRRDYYAIKAGEQQKQTVQVKCPNCPTYKERITIITKERDTFQLSLKDKEAELAALQAKYAQLDSQRISMETLIRELEERLRNSGDNVQVTIREKETIIITLTEKLRLLEEALAAKDAEIADLQGKLGNLLGVCSDLDARVQEFQGVREKLEELTRIKIDLELRITELMAELNAKQGQDKLIAVLEEQVAYCKANHGKKELPSPIQAKAPESITWYYAVQDPLHAQLFQKERVYQGGEIVIDSMEGATVVNPDYYIQSEKVEGSSRLRVRVVYAQVPGASAGLTSPSTEVFVRLRLGSATQFTPPRPHSQSVAWNQDFVFVGVPVVEKEGQDGVFIPAESLIVEVVSRSIGGAAETLLGSAVVDLANIIYGLTRQVIVSLNKGGVVNLRVKALDFGCPAGVSTSMEETTSRSIITEMSESSANPCEVALDVRREDVYGRIGIEHEELQSFAKLLHHHGDVIRNSPQKITATYTVTTTSSSSLGQN